MALFDLFRKNSDLENPNVKLTADTNIEGALSSQAHITPENAMQIASVYACVYILAANVAQLPLQLLKKENGKSEKATDHKLYELLHDSPNDFQTSYKLREYTMASVLLHGNGYIEIDRNNKGQVVALHSLDPRYVNLMKNAKTNRHYYVVMDEGKQRTLSIDDVIHLKGLGDIKQGVSVVRRHAQTLGLGLSARDYSYSLFSSNARPSAIITPQRELNLKEWEVLQVVMTKKMRAMNENRATAGATMLLPQDLKYTPLSISPVDAELLAIMKLNRSEIAGLFNIPAHMINDLEKATFSNITEQTIQFIRFSLMPWLVNFEQEINRKLFTKREKDSGYYVKFNVSGLMRGTPKERADFYHFGILDGWLSRNEARQLEDLNTVEGLDEFLISVNTSQTQDNTSKRGRKNAK